MKILINNIVMILDNARIHHTKLVKPFLKKNNQRLTFVFLPPYSPDLNLLERIWKALKKASSLIVFMHPKKK
ncbi:transposase [Bacillus cereus]|uniref:transposase n=1 Tax=Bacillus cereus TaxID=1396 RepID=UPI000BEDE2E3|nr:transposase [Bacillus cereus]PEF60361.1 hypothetical protein CON35_31395 [Bacillus cereus]